MDDETHFALRYSDKCDSCEELFAAAIGEAAIEIDV
jgi:hypothetical protein